MHKNIYDSKNKATLRQYFVGSTYFHLIYAQVPSVYYRHKVYRLTSHIFFSLLHKRTKKHLISDLKHSLEEGNRNIVRSKYRMNLIFRHQTQ